MKGMLNRRAVLLFPVLLSFSNEKIVLDEKVAPGDNFYRYVCNNWMKENPLSKGRIVYDVASQISERNEEKINAIFEELKRNQYQDGSVEQKLKDLYVLAMDMKKRQEGRAELIKIFNEIEKAKSINELRKIQYRYAFCNIGIPFKIVLGPDYPNPSQHILCVEQPIHNKHYYLSDDKHIQQMREEWRKHAVNMLRLFNFDEATASKKMEQVYHWEIECAKICMTRAEVLRRKDSYSKISLQEFLQKYPHIPLVELFEAKGGDKKYLQELVIGQPEFLHNMDQKLAQQTVDELKSLMEADLIKTFAFYLDEPVLQEAYNFKQSFDLMQNAAMKEMLNLKQDMPVPQEIPTLKKLVMEQLNDEMGNAIGQLFCEKYFPESSKKKILTLVETLKDAFAERIAAQSWLSENSKKAALGKLSDIRVMVACPNQWDDYSGLKIDKSKSYMANIMVCKEFHEQEELKRRLGKSIDKEAWPINPHADNCCYYPAQNAIYVPAGMLQAPYFDPNADDATNFGAIGTIIGREITHAFYTERIHLPKAEKEAFFARSIVGEEYFPYVEVYPELKQNQLLTLDDNILNHGAIKVAYQAYKKATNGNGDDKKFFISFAAISACNVTDERVSFLTHYKHRLFGQKKVNGTLAHIDAWYNAFDVKPGHKLFIPKEKRFDLW